MTTYPQAQIPAFLAGYTPNAATMEDWIQAPLQFLTQKPLFRGIQQLSGGQALTSSTFDALQIGGTTGDVLEDPYGGWSTVSTSGQAAWSYLVPFTGLYEVTVSVPILSAALWLNSAVQVSGGQVYWMDSALQPSGVAGGCCGILTVGCVGGQDYIQAGTAVSANATTNTSFPKVYPSLDIAYVGAS